VAVADGAQAAARSAILEALGLPALILGASYLGFGSLVRENGLPIWVGVASTAFAWALPGQVVMVELLGTGASVAAVLLAVLLTNARLLPMAVTLVPHLRRPASSSWHYYLAANFIAVTSWANAMRAVPLLPRDHRLTWFFTFAGTLWAVTLAGTVAGYLLSAVLPRPVALALVFLNPIYFMMVLAGDLRRRGKLAAVVLGAVLGPLLHRWNPDWGLLATGVLAGSLAFLVDRPAHG
jgi:predicted branched-subunit amino acid permease